MFESDDFDQVLSQFDFPEVDYVKPQDIVIPSTEPGSQDYIACTNESKTDPVKTRTKDSAILDNFVIVPKYFTNNPQSIKTSGLGLKEDAIALKSNNARDSTRNQFDFPEVDSVKPQNIVIQSTEPGGQDFIACRNESKAAPVQTKTKDPSIPDNFVPVPKYFTNNQSMKTSGLKQSGPEDDGRALNSNNARDSTRNANDGDNLTKKSIEHNTQQVNFVSPKHLKRKIINSHFDRQSKRKFPGPAGLLNGVLEEAKDESIGHIEFLSQDMEFTENNLQRDIFESPLWKRLLSDTQAWRVHNVDSIKAIKQQALAGNLRRRKAQTVTAFIEAVDRSVTDPLIILRDETGSIKCTLHRDAWSTFAPYIVSEYCALVLQKPTVLTTGGAFKKHYLNITLSNILAIFSSAVLKDEMILPSGYKILYDEDFTVIKMEKCLENTETLTDASNGAEDILDLDNFFSDEIF